MSRTFRFLLPLLITALALLSFTMKGKTYTYIDGNNNTYTITPAAVDYKPVKKEESSSGTYSGGEPKMVSITKMQFVKVEMLIAEIKKDKVNIIPERNMGCGTLSSGKAKPIYINMNSKNKAALEAELQMLLGK